MHQFILRNIEELEIWLNEQKNFSLALTNGVFDILHPGHIEYLIQTKKKADKLLVAINSDKSVKKLKGDSRPINDQYSRALLLSQLKPVDKVIVFEDNPIEIMLKAKAKIYVKAGDYTIETLNQEERKALEKVKTKIQFVSFKQGYSTTEIINKIKS